MVEVNLSRNTIRTCVIVVGMHRSGTSVLGGTLSRLGIDFGPNLLPPQKGVNEKGFYEHSDIVNIHDRIFQFMERSWFDLRPMPDKWWLSKAIQPFQQELEFIIERDFSNSKYWGIKDPRICRLLPLWSKTLKCLNITPLCFLIIREPFEVAASLEKRDRLPAICSLLLWQWYNLEGEYFSRPFQRVVLSYPDLLNNWQKCLHNAYLNLGLKWPENIADLKQEIDEFVDVRMRHASGNNVISKSEFENFVSQVYADLLKLRNISGNLDEKHFVRLQNTIEKVMPFMDIINQVQNTTIKISNRNHQLEEEVDGLSQLLNAEKQNAREQIEYRNALVKDLENLLSAEKQNAREQIEYRDALIRELESQIESERDNARKQIEFRDEKIKNLEIQLKSKLGLLKALFKK